MKAALLGIPFRGWKEQPICWIAKHERCSFHWLWGCSSVCHGMRFQLRTNLPHWVKP
jgi:hypothetical protein